MNSLLSKNNLENTSSLLYEDDPKINEYRQIQKDLSNKFNQDFPSLESVHYYSFPKDTDTIKLAEQLRSLSYVETAYVTPIGHTTSTPNPNFISRQGIGNIHTNLPAYTNDPALGPSNAENLYWSWFNHHKIFQAWDIYRANFGNVDISLVSNSDKPVIAVIDDGFYKGVDADAPTYLTGKHFDVYANPIDNDTSQHTQYNINNPKLEKSHGTSMANIIASPKNNGVGACGVIPGATIYPVKIDYYLSPITGKYSLMSSSMAAVIRNAADQPSVDVINCSLAVSSNSLDEPISYNSDVDLAIQYATSTSKNKVVVLSAGNTNTALDSVTTFDSYGNPTNPVDYNSIIVGGSSSYNGKEWTTSSTEGTGYGKIVDLAAQGEEVYAPTWQVSSNSLSSSNNIGTSASTAIVSGIAGMIKKLAQKKSVSYTPYEIRNLIAYTGTLGITNSSKLLGRALSSSNNVNGLAKMRDLNAWAALTVVNNSNYPRLVRIFNNDDYTWATTNGDWNAKYTQEAYFDDAFWGFPSGLPSGTATTYYTSNAGGNGSFGYQEYIYGKVGTNANTNVNTREKINGVLSRYDTSNSNQQAYYYTVGSNATGWFGGGGTWY